jgi:hypothetical protein
MTARSIATPVYATFAAQQVTLASFVQIQVLYIPYALPLIARNLSHIWLKYPMPTFPVLRYAPACSGYLETQSPAKWEP